MASSIRNSTFVPPYVFDQLSRVDPSHSEAWKQSATQARSVLTARMQESLFSFAQAQRPIQTIPIESEAYKPQVTVISTQDDDSDVINARKNGVVTLQFLYKKLNRKSFDDRGSELKIYVHDEKSLNNAFWKSEDDTVHIGDSTESEYTTLTEDADIIGHEIGHGVVKYTAGFIYTSQSGALDESWADVLGSMVKQYKLRQTAEKADWLIGDAFIKDIGRVQALRSMKAPGTAYEFDEENKDLQVDHMREYKEMPNDNGGVHINSGIPNKAFYLFAMTFSKRYSWEIAGQVWYKALKRCTADTNFLEFAEITVQVSMEFPSQNQKEIVLKVCRSWKKVGILTSKYALETRDILPSSYDYMGSGSNSQNHLQNYYANQAPYRIRLKETDVEPGYFCQTEGCFIV